MSWWGKVIGGTFGFMLGGPLGALLGASFGHNFDRSPQNAQLGGVFGQANVDVIQSAFFTATFSMMGHVAKSDGQVSDSEIFVAENIMQQMHLNPEQKKIAINLFDQGKKADFPVEEVLQQFKQECHRRRTLIQMFIEILLMTALADGHLHEAENRVLEKAAESLGFSKLEYQQILGRMQAQAHYHQQGASAGSVNNTAMSIDDAYQLLGVSANASDAEVKKAYRRQMNQHHPDKLVSKGLPQEMMDIANQKAQDIKAAYDLIRDSRKS